MAAGTPTERHSADALGRSKRRSTPVVESQSAVVTTTICCARSIGDAARGGGAGTGAGTATGATLGAL
jgi:hypothetical protein